MRHEFREHLISEKDQKLIKLRLIRNFLADMAGTGKNGQESEIMNARSRFVKTFVKKK